MGAPPERLGPRRVHAPEVAVEARDTEQVERHLEKLGAAREHVQLPDVRVVETVRQKTSEGAVRILIRRRAHVHVPQGAIVPAQPDLGLEALAAREVLVILGEVALEIPGMNRARPAVPELLRQRPTGEREPSRIAVVALCVRSRTPNHGRRLLGERAVLLEIRHFHARRMQRRRDGQNPTLTQRRRFRCDVHHALAQERALSHSQLHARRRARAL